MHYYSHHIGDLIRDTANLDDHQLVTYMRMIWAYYQSEQPLENNLEDIAFAMRSDEKTVRLLLRHYFVLDGDLWRHTRCDKEIANYHGKSEKAKQSAKKRWTKPDLVPADSECNADAQQNDANAQKSDANQEPRTKNQEPRTKRERESAAKAPRPLKKCPADFLITQEMQSWAIENAGTVDLKTETEKFMDYTFSSTRLDWLGTWRNWMRKAQEYAEKHKPDKPYETPYARSMREKYEKITPMIAAQNPHAPKKINPNDFINGLGDFKNDAPKLRIAG